MKKQFGFFFLTEWTFNSRATLAQMAQEETGVMRSLLFRKLFWNLCNIKRSFRVFMWWLKGHKGIPVSCNLRENVNIVQLLWSIVGGKGTKWTKGNNQELAVRVQEEAAAHHLTRKHSSQTRRQREVLLLFIRPAVHTPKSISQMQQSCLRNLTGCRFFASFVY